MDKITIDTILKRTEESKADKVEVLELFKLCDNCKQPLTQYVKITQHSEDGKESKEICPYCLKNPIKGSVLSCEAVNYPKYKETFIEPEKPYPHQMCKGGMIF